MGSSGSSIVVARDAAPELIWPKRAASAPRRRAALRLVWHLGKHTSPKKCLAQRHRRHKNPSQNSYYRNPPTKQFRNVVRHAAGESSPPKTENTTAAKPPALAKAPGPALSGIGEVGSLCPSGPGATCRPTNAANGTAAATAPPVNIMRENSRCKRTRWSLLVSTAATSPAGTAADTANDVGDKFARKER